MAEGTLTADDLRNGVGMEWEPLVYEITEEMIRRCTRAIGDPNPMWQDKEYAGKSQYGGIIAPPTFVWTIGLVELMERIGSVEAFVSMLNGGAELEYFKPIRPGDVITAVTKLSNVREREGNLGRMLFMSLETTYKNQRQELVARCLDLAIGNLG
jgi:acyl dehydratase